MSTVLIGYRGSGKTTIGRLLADRLWQEFVDVDERIEGRAGKTIAAIFADDGEPAFRDLESAVIAEVAKLEDYVIALGGGAVVREANAQALLDAGHKMIYLKCEPELLLQRIQGDPKTAESRPNLTSLGGGLQEVRLKLAEREPLYRKYMHAELDVSNLSPEEAVVYITRLM